MYKKYVEIRRLETSNRPLHSFFGSVDLLHEIDCSICPREVAANDKSSHNLIVVFDSRQSEPCPKPP
jgi:hypothetical protein